jgi:hypothetical protein
MIDQNANEGCFELLNVIQAHQWTVVIRDIYQLYLSFIYTRKALWLSMGANKELLETTTK